MPDNTVMEKAFSTKNVDTRAGAPFKSSIRFGNARVSGHGRDSDCQSIALTARNFDTPLGSMLAVTAEQGLVALDFCDSRGMSEAIERLRHRFGRQGFPTEITPGDHPHLTAIDRELTEYFAGTRQEFSISHTPHGTDFELRAWKVLAEIPYGQTRSYGEQARKMGTTAVRGVGRANGNNYLAIIIPCHRVIGANGKLTGYGGGLPRKRWLLEHEKKHCRASLADTLFDSPSDIR